MNDLIHENNNHKSSCYNHCNPNSNYNCDFYGNYIFLVSTDKKSASMCVSKYRVRWLPT